MPSELTWVFTHSLVFVFTSRLRGGIRSGAEGAGDGVVHGRSPGVSPPFAFKSVSGAAGAVEGVELREFLGGELEVEDLAVVRDPVPVPANVL
jgi:hypothetical protein